MRAKMTSKYGILVGLVLLLASVSACGDGEGGMFQDVTIDPAIVFSADGWVTSHAWTDNAAMLAHYRAWLIRELKNERLAAMHKAIQPEDFE